MLLFSCADLVWDDDAEHTSQGGPRVIESADLLGDHTCNPPLGAAKEVGLALEAVLYAFDTNGLLKYGNETFKTLAFDQGGSYGIPSVCFVDGGLNAYGLQRGNSIWVSLSGPDSTTLAREEWALVHELVHFVAERGCVLPGCSPNPDHSDLRLFHVQASVEERAKIIWSSLSTG